MPTPREDGRPGLLGEPPEDVRVTVTMLPGRSRQALREQVAGVAVRARKRALIIAGVGSLAFLAAVPLSGLSGSARNVGSEPAATYSARGAAAHAVAGRCSNATIASKETSAHPGEFRHAIWCMRYAAHADSIFYRFIGGPLPAVGSAPR